VELGLSGRTAIVCGASQGMGLAIAAGLRAEGANVVMFARRPEELGHEASRLGALAAPGDLTVPSDVEALVERTLAAFGGIDIVVLNGAGPPPGTAVSMTPEQVTAAVELLLVSHVRLVGLCLDHLQASRHGRIVAIESTSVKEPLPNLALSNAIRPGVAGWLRTLARELGPDGITINTIAPGRIDTERLRSLYPNGLSDADLEPIALRRVGTPAEIADVVCFLASDRASYVTGTVLAVDGGFSRGA
jgi:3-oxoacyl-[acyl-carrier protein] reductase